MDRKFDAQPFASLKTGLDMLSLGVQSREAGREGEARDRLNAALRDCVGSTNYFSKLLADELAELAPDRAELRVFTRQLAMGLLGVAACHVRLGDDELAVGCLHANLPLLRRASGHVFERTLGEAPGRLVGLPGSIDAQCEPDLHRCRQSVKPSRAGVSRGWPGSSAAWRGRGCEPFRRRGPS